MGAAVWVTGPAGMARERRNYEIGTGRNAEDMDRRPIRRLRTVFGATRLEY